MHKTVCYDCITVMPSEIAFKNFRKKSNFGDALNESYPHVTHSTAILQVHWMMILSPTSMAPIPMERIFRP